MPLSIENLAKLLDKIAIV